MSTKAGASDSAGFLQRTYKHCPHCLERLVRYSADDGESFWFDCGTFIHVTEISAYAAQGWTKEDYALRRRSLVCIATSKSPSRLYGLPPEAVYQALQGVRELRR